LGGQES
jgi:dTDP-4-amino-4,6-dideoxygalactose transaminase